VRRDDPPEPGAPVGRRDVLGLLGLGALGIATGDRLQRGLESVPAAVELHDPTGLVALLPLGNTFRSYPVTARAPRRTAVTYRLAVSGEVAQPTTYTLADLQAMPQTTPVWTSQPRTPRSARCC